MCLPRIRDFSSVTEWGEIEFEAVLTSATNIAERSKFGGWGEVEIKLELNTK